MDWERLFLTAERARHARVPAPDEAFVRDAIPAALSDFPDMSLPRRIKHPGGFAVSGRPVGTFARTALLVAGTRVFGPRYKGAPFYERIETDLALGIMRSNFNLGYPKGTFCCQTCTLAILPALAVNAIRHFDCGELRDSVEALIQRRMWRFTSSPNKRLLSWALES